MELGPIIKKINIKGDGHPFGFGLSPEADWRVILVATIILAAIVSAFNVFLFMGVNDGEALTLDDEDSSASKSLNINELKTTASYYAEKAAQFEKIKAGADAGADPSN